MALKVRGVSDESLECIGRALAQYEAAHPKAKIDLYRQSSVSIRIRIVDPDFAGLPRAERHERLWQILEPLGDEVLSQISVLLLLTPAEKKQSFANVEFDHPVATQS